MLVAALFGVAVHGADTCAGLTDAMCIMADGCWYNSATGCSQNCVDMGIPPPFNAFFPSCDSICDAPMLMLAASMFCAESCGLCPTPEPAMEPTEEPTEEPDVFELSMEDCSRQEIQNEIELAIYEQIDAGSFDAVAPCLRMRSHLAYALDMDDQLVGTPNGFLICDCLNNFKDDDEWARTHLNCQLAGFQIYDLSKECLEIGGYAHDTCDLDAIEAVMVQEPACADFRTNIATFGSFAFNPTSVCGCFDEFDPVTAAKTFNCMIGGKHLMELYTDVCPAYVAPCDRTTLEKDITDYIVENLKIDQLSGPCMDMAAHFNDVLDSETDTMKAGAYADFALICQCLGGFSRAFVDAHLRCGVAGHDAFSIWSQCTEHTPTCEDMNCALCEQKIRCSMSTDGTCKRSCPNDGTCFDDPAVTMTCEDL